MTTLEDDVFLLDFLFRAAAEGILITESHGEVARVNPAAAAILGMSPDAMIGQRAAAVFKFSPGLLRLMDGHGAQQGTVDLPHKRVAMGTSDDLPNGGRVVLLHDITEREHLDSRRDALIRQVAHDFRNPLNALDGYADLVARFGNLSPEQDKFMGRVRQTAQKLYELAETLVDLAWIEAGMALNHQPCELAHLIREAADEVAKEAQLNAITLVISVQDPIPTLIGDPHRLRQMLVCLLKNAVRYSYPESNVAIHAWQDGLQVICSIGDQGFGISVSDMDMIWDRMWRANDERVRGVPGGGIGLTFARAIVQRHSGRIWVESALNAGTTVTIVLPLAEGW